MSQSESKPTRTRCSETRVFAVVGTGHEIRGPGYRYLGTALVCDNNLVWHLFDMGLVAQKKAGVE